MRNLPQLLRHVVLVRILDLLLIEFCQLCILLTHPFVFYHIVPPDARPYQKSCHLLHRLPTCRFNILRKAFDHGEVEQVCVWDQLPRGLLNRV